VARSSLEFEDEGFATATAMVISLVLAMGAAAIVEMAVTNLKAARASLERTQAESQLAGGHLLAALDISENIRSGRLRWNDADGQNTFQILAEPERDKFDVAHVLSDRPNLLSQLGARDTAKTAALLRAQLDSDRPLMIGEADPSTLWKTCAASVLSYFGGPNYGPLQSAQQPDRLALRSRAGEIWRVRVTSGEWTDDRIVRLTGNGQEPALTIQRRFSRDGDKGGETCSALIATQ
jgi:hypothetical protein